MLMKENLRNGLSVHLFSSSCETMLTHVSRAAKTTVGIDIQHSSTFIATRVAEPDLDIGE